MKWLLLKGCRTPEKIFVQKRIKDAVGPDPNGWRQVGISPITVTPRLEEPGGLIG